MKKPKLLKDSRGVEYEEKLLDPKIVKREKFIDKSFKEVERLEAVLKEKRAKLDKLISEYLVEYAKTEVNDDWKGSARITDFGQRRRIAVTVDDLIDFNETLQLAKQKIDECVKKWSKNSDIKLAYLVREAFQVDKKGQFNRTAILKLRHLNIKDKEWEDAMRLINESIVVVCTKQRVNFYRKKDKKSKWELINLNFLT